MNLTHNITATEFLYKSIAYFYNDAPLEYSQFVRDRHRIRYVCCLEFLASKELILCTLAGMTVTGQMIQIK